MAGMTGGVEIETKAQGGLLGGLKRSVLGGESFFINTFTRTSGPATVSVAADAPGRHRAHAAGRLARHDGAVGLVARRARPASTSTRSGAARRRSSAARDSSCCKCTGRATCWSRATARSSSASSPPGESYKVDTGHIVAFPEGMGYAGQQGRRAGSPRSSAPRASSTDVHRARARLWLQTRSPQDLIGWLTANMPGSRSTASSATLELRLARASRRAAAGSRSGRAPRAGRPGAA